MYPYIDFITPFFKKPRDYLFSWFYPFSLFSKHGRKLHPSVKEFSLREKGIGYYQLQNLLNGIKSSNLEKLDLGKNRLLFDAESLNLISSFLRGDRSLHQINFERNFCFCMFENSCNCHIERPYAPERKIPFEKIEIQLKINLILQAWKGMPIEICAPLLPFFCLEHIPESSEKILSAIQYKMGWRHQR